MLAGYQVCTAKIRFEFLALILDRSYIVINDCSF